MNVNAEPNLANRQLIEDMYAKFLEDPWSVDSWLRSFRKWISPLNLEALRDSAPRVRRRRFARI